MTSVWSYQPDMPSFRDADGTLWEWDSTNDTYVKTQGDDFDHDRSHSFGGDANLFDPAQGDDGQGHGNLFQPKNPMMEGYMASVWDEDDVPSLEQACPNCAQTMRLRKNWHGSPPVGAIICPHCKRGQMDIQKFVNPDDMQPGDLTLPWGEAEQQYYRTSNEWAAPNEVKCPNCAETTRDRSCPQCGKDLTPEWHKHQDEDIAFDQPPQHHHLDGMPERVPRPNHDHWDNSFPSMISHLRRLGVAGTDGELMNMLMSGPLKTEIGKWLIDRQGQLHYEHGMQAAHERIAARDGLNWPNDVGVTGSVYNDGSAEVLRVYPNYPFNAQQVTPQLEQAFGEGIHLDGPVSGEPAQTKGMMFQPFPITTGQWLIAPNGAQNGPITGIAWVKERANGTQYAPNMIFVAEHLVPEDVASGVQPVAVVTATGGAASHAAYLASTQGIPCVVGIGPEYNKIETGNYLKIDPTSKTITVIPAATEQSSPEEKHQLWNSILQYQHGVEKQMTPKPTFSHVDEELAWKAAHPVAVIDCPECLAPMMEKNASVFCPDCGHVSAVRTAGPELLALPLLEEGLGGAAAGGAGGAAGGLGQVGGLMNKALQGAAWQTGKEMLPGGGQPQQGMQQGAAPQDDSQSQGVIAASGAFGEEEVGRGVKNDGQNSDPDQQSSSGDDQKEFGDSPEQLKDVDGIGGPKSSDGTDAEHSDLHMHDPALQDKALKAFHMNMPLVIEFANSDEDGSQNPLLVALDELLEQAFPGYKGGTDPDGGTPLEEHPDAPSEESSGSDDSSDDDKPKEESKPKESNFTLWHVGHEVEAAAWGDPTMAPPGGMPGAMPQGNSCPVCGQIHMPGACPMQQAQHGLTSAPTGPQPVMPGSGTAQQVITHDKASKWKIVGADVAEHTEHHQHEHHHETQPAGDPTDPRGDQHQWLDDSGQPLSEGSDYELRSPNYEIPDRITVTNILPEKLIFTIHSGDVDYQDEITKQDIANEGYSFGPVVDPSQNDSEDGFTPEEAPVRPGADAAPQVTDLSSPATVVSSLEEYTGSYDGDDPEARAHVLGGGPGGGIEVDPFVLAQVMGNEMEKATGSRSAKARYAGKDFSPREQREFIDESGTARNLDQLNLAGTHYVEDDVDFSFNW